MIFSSELNTLAWQIKKSQNISWGAAFRLAIKMIQVPAHPQDTSVLGTWTFASCKAVAGHFWGLSKAYSEIGDTGRSIAMRKVSNSLYAMYECYENVTFKSLIRQKGIKESIASEIVDYFKASATGGYTDRTLDLIAQGAQDYANRVHAARWTF